MLRRAFKALNNKRGSQMIEASISMPVIILAVMLMIRMFTFYLEILTAEIDQHREVMQKQDSYNGAFIRTYRDSKEIHMIRGGLLGRSVSKDLEVKAYFINEDLLVRSGELID